MKTAIFTPTRNLGIEPSFLSVYRQNPPVDYWLVADQLAVERSKLYTTVRDIAGEKGIKIDTYQCEIFPGKLGNLAHVHNWALKRARELEIDLLVFMQDFIWVPKDGVAKFAKAAKYHPFDLITGNVVSSKGPPRTRWDDSKCLWSIWEGTKGEGIIEPPLPYEPDTRDQMGWWQPDSSLTRGVPDLGDGKYISQHAWEVNWGAMPHAIINAGIDFDEDYDYGTQWENTDFAHQVKNTFQYDLDGKGRVWWDHENKAISMPHRDYFPKVHEGERDHDNGWRFRQKWGNV